MPASRSLLRRLLLLLPAMLPCLPALLLPAQNTAQTQPPAQTRDLKPVQTGKAAPVAVPRSYAVVIGISTYKNLPPSAQLAFPNRDAEDIFSALISPEGGQFPAENVHLLLNEHATVANIKHEIDDWLPSVTQPNDRVLVYFAGHGFIADGKGWLAPYDVDSHDVAGTAYAMNELGETFGGRIQGKWKVLITDACHSGAITPEADRKQVNDSLLDLQKSLFSLTASRDREKSFESAKWGGGHGIFTYYVVKGLEGEADTNGDGIVDADELAEYVHTNVRQATGGEQNPTSERGSFDPNMLLAYNPTRTRGGAAPVQFGNLVIESNMNQTEVFVDGRSAGVVAEGTPLRLPGLAPGPHIVKGVHRGYEPDGPREEQVYPGQDTTVSIRLLIARRANHTAVEQFDQGMELYNRGYEENYRKAATHFEAAIAEDPTYSKAYVFLGRAENALFEDEKALAAFKKAIELDPDYEEARASYAGALLDTGSLDEAIRQLNVVTQREPDRGFAWYLQAQAYARKGAYAECKTSATMAIKRTPRNGEAHFWLGECLRQLKDYPAAEAEYSSYLALSNYDSGTAGQLNYYVLGSLFGMGKRTHAAQTDIWKELHGQANLGLCVSELMQKHFDPAITFCQRSLAFIPRDLFANYRLGVLYVQKVNAESTSQQAQLPLLAAARTHFNAAIAANPDAIEAERSRQYLKNIDQALESQSR